MKRLVCRTLLLVPVAIAAALLLPVSAASAQCFGPDGLDVPGACCVPVVPNLPPFPNAVLPGLGICFNQCSTNTTNPLRVDWSAPAQPQCGQFTTTLTVTDGGSGAAIMVGTLVLDYTRTWDEIDTTGLTTQVWRFAAKVDLMRAPGAPVLCPMPSCITPVGPHPTAFFYGYVDYAGCGVAGGTWEQSLVLYHACDRFIHQPVLSDRPGVFHPGGAYAIVAPHSAAQPFVPGNAVAPGGPLFGEAMRDHGPVTPPPNVCISEDPIVLGSLTPLGAGCVCTMSNFPKQQTLRQVSGQTICVNTAGVSGGFASLNINFPVLPWFHMVSTSIGTWTSPASYPGVERAWVDEGLFVHQSACNGDYVELKYGGSTRGGWTPILPIPVIVDGFTDLADNYTAPLFGPYPTPILGSVRPTEHLIYVNVP